jgi:hypothetical protein
MSDEFAPKDWSKAPDGLRNKMDRDSIKNIVRAASIIADGRPPMWLRHGLRDCVAQLRYMIAHRQIEKEVLTRPALRQKNWRLSQAQSLRSKLNSIVRRFCLTSLMATSLLAPRILVVVGCANLPSAPE